MKNENNVANLPEEGFIRLPQVLAIFPVSRSGWFAGVNSGIYPKGDKLGARAVAWKVSDIRKLINSVGGDK